MKKIFVVFVMIIGVSTLARAAAFEGLLDYEMHDSKERVIPMHYEVKGPLLRITMENEGKKAIMIFDSPNNSMIMLMPDQKMAMKHELPKPSDVKKPSASGKKVNFTDTGKTDTVAGHPCKIFTFLDDTTDGEVCNAEGMGTFQFAAGRQGAGNESGSWAQEARAKGLFPLRIVMKGIKSGKTTTIVATRIEKKSVPSSDFEVPSDYKMMEGMGAMMGGAAHAQGSAMGEDFRSKMMNATPEERQKMIEDMRKQFGAKKE